MEELLDDNGYPTEYALEKITNWNLWDLESLGSFAKLMEFIKTLWYYPDYVNNDENNVYTLVTIGWSGNEDIIRAMEKNSALQCLYWYSSERGGKHVYAPMGYMGKD
jgi:hypothetical protein